MHLEISIKRKYLQSLRLKKNSTFLFLQERNIILFLNSLTFVFEEAHNCTTNNFLRIAATVFPSTLITKVVYEQVYQFPRTVPYKDLFTKEQIYAVMNAMNKKLSKDDPNFYTRISAEPHMISIIRTKYQQLYETNMMKNLTEIVNKHVAGAQLPANADYHLKHFTDLIAKNAPTTLPKETVAALLRDVLTKSYASIVYKTASSNSVRVEQSREKTNVYHNIGLASIYALVAYANTGQYNIAPSIYYQNPCSQ